MKAMQKIIALILALCALATALPVSSAEEALSVAQLELLTAAEVTPASAPGEPSVPGGTPEDIPTYSVVQADAVPDSEPAAEAVPETTVPAEMAAEPAGEETDASIPDLPAGPSIEATIEPTIEPPAEILPEETLVPSAEPSAEVPDAPVPEPSASATTEPAVDSAEDAMASPTAEPESLPLLSAEAVAAEQTALQPIEHFELGFTTYKMSAGETLQLNPVLYPLDQPHAVTYRSSRPDIASVDENGLVTAIVGGEAFITITDVVVGKQGFNASHSIDITVESDEHNFIQGPYSNNTLVGYEGIGGHVAIPNGFTAIGSAFKNNKSITSVYIPDSVTAIRDSFTGCTNLQSVRLPAHLESIRESAFERCLSLVSVDLPEGLKTVGERAFFDCQSLVSVTLPGSLKTIAEDTFSNCESLQTVVIPEGVERINGFANCKSLEEITLPGSVKSIGGNAFSNSGLKSIQLPRGLESIGYYTFKDCTSLESIVIPEGVTTLGHSIFEGCTSLKSVTIPSSVASFGDRTFSNCPNVVLKVPKNSPAHDYCEEKGLRYEFNGEMLVFDIEDGVLYNYYGSDSSIAIPEGVTKIADGVFEGMDFITELRLPSSLEEIGSRAFYACAGLSSLDFPSGLKSIGSEAFAHCPLISALEIPASVEKIGEKAFQGIYGLKSLILHGGGEIGALAITAHELERIEIHGNVKSIGSNAFASSSDTLQEVIVHEGVASIASGAFPSSALKKITLPASLITIEKDAFINNAFLHAYVPAGSAAQAFCDKYGILYSFHGAYDESDAFIIEGDTLVKYAGTAEHVVIPENVSIIGEKAFLHNTTLRTVRFHDGIYLIWFNAFQGCTALEELNLPATPDLKVHNYAFQGCTSLTSLTIPGNVTFIGADCFGDCTSLESVVYEKGYYSVGGYKGCTSLKSVTIPEGVVSISDSAFQGCTSLKTIDLPDSLNSIGSWSFAESAIEKITFPDEMDFIGYWAFENCLNLTSISLPRELNYIDSEIFEGCTNLRSVFVPNGPNWIRKEVFKDCTNLRSVYLPASIKSIEENIFLNCPNLTVITPNGSSIARYCKENGIPWARPDTSAKYIRFPEGSLTLGAGQAYQLKCEADSDYALGTVSFSSSSAKVVSVDRVTGEIKALKTGSATITAKAQSGAKASCKITVKKAPDSIEFAEKEIILGLGERMQLSCILPKNTAAGLTFEGSNFFALHVEPDGWITAVGPGTDTVTVTTHNGASASCTVMVPEAPSQVILEQAEISIPQTLTCQLSPAVNAGSICRNFSYVSSDPAIASVDERGLISAHAMGTVQITVSVAAAPEVFAVCNVTVTDPPPRIVLAAEALTLGLKESFDLKPGYDGGFSGSFSCASSNSKAVAVTDSGVITAKKAGTAVITVTGENGLSAVCKVTVKKAPGSIKLSAANLKLGAGESIQLAYTLSSGSAGSVRFECSNPEIAAVSDDGTIRAMAPGSAEIIARTYNGKKASAKLTVFAAPESIVLERIGNPLKLGVGESGTLGVQFNAGSFGSYRFESSDSNIVEIDAGGKFRAKMLGECSITVTAYNGVSETRKVQVCMPPKKLEFDSYYGSKVTIGVGQKQPLYLYYYAENNVPCGPGLSFKSSNTKVAAVDVNGVVTGLKPGTATITVTSFNGLKDTSKITVKKAPTAISLNADTLYMGYCETFPLEAVLTPSGCWGNVQYSISDESAAWFDDNGLLLANRRQGSAVVTATTYNGLSASCTVYFGPEPGYVEFPQEEITLCVGMQLPLDFESDGYFSSYSVRTSDKKIAYVDDDGMLIAKKKGSAEITVETYNKKSAVLKVTVEPAPKKHVLDLPMPLHTGRLYNLLDYFSSTPSYDPMLLIKSISINNDCALLSKEEDGWYLLPVKAGSITLTIKTLNSSMRVKAAIVPGADPDLPDISSPVDPSAVFSDYTGTWKLVCLGSISDGQAIPPEMMGVTPYIINVYQGTADIISDDNSLYGFPAYMDGHTLILDTIGNKIPAQLHQNGYLTLPQETEGVHLWFEKQ